MRKKLIFKIRNINLAGKKNNIILNHPNSHLIKNDSYNDFFLSTDKQNSKSLIKEFNYIQKIYEKNLTNLTKFLNEFHNVNHSKIYWRTLIGVWLYKFITIVIDRWRALKKVTTKYKEIDIENLRYRSESFIPYGIEDFNYFIETDDWNNYIFLEIIDILKFDSIKKENNKKGLILEESKEIYKRLSIKHNSYKAKILKNFQYYLLKVNHNLKYFIFDTYLSSADEIRMNLRLNKKPLLFKSLKFDLLYPSLIESKTKISKERNIDKKKAKNSPDNLLYNLSKKNLPKTYLEDFDLSNKVLEKYTLPKKPKVIFSTMGLCGRSTLMDIYAAKSVMNGTKIVLAQHGGNYGQHKIHNATIHEGKISQRFLSWGFKGGKKIKPLGIIKKDIDEIKHNNNKKLIIIEARSRNFYTHTLRINYGPIDGLTYMKKLCEFFSNIKDQEIINQLRIKLHGVDFGLKDKDFFYKANKKIKYLDQSTKTSSYYNDTKLVIHTFPGTGHLEAMASNIPNLVFFFNDLNLLNSKTKKYFIEFKKVGIMHDSPTSLTDHLKKISKDPAKWWFSKKIQLIRKQYVKDFAKINKNLINDIVTNLKDV